MLQCWSRQEPRPTEASVTAVEARLDGVKDVALGWGLQLPGKEALWHTPVISAFRLSAG